MFILFFEWKIKEVGLKLVFRYLCDLMRVRKMFTFQSTKISHCPEKPEMHCCHYFIQYCFQITILLFHKLLLVGRMTSETNGILFNIVCKKGGEVLE